MLPRSIFMLHCTNDNHINTLQNTTKTIEKWLMHRETTILFRIRNVVR